MSTSLADLAREESVVAVLRLFSHAPNSHSEHLASKQKLEKILRTEQTQPEVKKFLDSLKAEDVLFCHFWAGCEPMLTAAAKRLGVKQKSGEYLQSFTVA